MLVGPKGKQLYFISPKLYITQKRSGFTLVLKGIYIINPYRKEGDLNGQTSEERHETAE